MGHQSEEFVLLEDEVIKATGGSAGPASVMTETQQERDGQTEETRDEGSSEDLYGDDEDLEHDDLLGSDVDLDFEDDEPQEYQGAKEASGSWDVPGLLLICLLGASLVLCGYACFSLDSQLRHSTAERAMLHESTPLSEQQYYVLRADLTELAHTQSALLRELQRLRNAQEASQRTSAAMQVLLEAQARREATAYHASRQMEAKGKQDEAIAKELERLRLRADSMEDALGGVSEGLWSIRDELVERLDEAGESVGEMQHEAAESLLELQDKMEALAAALGVDEQDMEDEEEDAMTGYTSVYPQCVHDL